MKTRFKDKVFTTLEDLKEWLYESVKNRSKATILSITSNPHFLNEFNAVFKIWIDIIHLRKIWMNT
jgi:protease II